MTARKYKLVYFNVYDQTGPRYKYWIQAIKDYFQYHENKKSNEGHRDKPEIGVDKPVSLV